jgi:hypothetical protein
MDSPKEVNAKHSDPCPEEINEHYLNTIYLQFKNELNEIEKKGSVIWK